MKSLYCSGLLLWPFICLAPHLIAQTSIDAVKPEILKQRLDLYKGSDTKREATLMQLFQEAGCVAPNVSEQPVRSRKQPNIICVLPGSTTETIVVGAHFDHVSDGDGIIDNWSGASMLPSLYQSLTRTPRRHTFIFIGFTGEENGEVGSKYYVDHLPPDQLSKIEAMVNMDTLALGPTKVWVSQSDPRLVSTLAVVAKTMNLPIGRLDIDGFGTSDEESFIRKGTCTITFHSLTPETIHVLHRPDDNPSAVRFPDYYESYHLLAAYLAVLDTQLVADGHVCTAKPEETPHP